MLNNFIYAKSKAIFEERIAEVPNEAIVFIEDTKEIWNHGTYFGGNEIDPELIDSLEIDVSELKANKLDKSVAESTYAKKTDIPTNTEYTNGTGIAISSNQISLDTTYKGYCDNANTLYTFYEGSNSVTTLTNIPVTKRLCFATVSASASLTMNGMIANGREVHIIIKNDSSADITVTMPTSSTYIHLGDSFFTVPAGGYAELNIISNGSKHYTRFI